LTLLRMYLNISPEDYVVMKIDIEGAEYQVLKRIIQHGMEFQCHPH